MIKIATDGKKRTILEIDGRTIGKDVIAIEFRHDCRLGHLQGPFLKLWLDDGTIWDSAHGIPCPAIDDDKAFTERVEMMGGNAK